MVLQDDLLKGFVETINKNKPDKAYDRVVYGTVSRKSGDLVYITIDGAEIETPANTLVEVGTGDRILATIKNHSIVVTGNISYPSVTRVGDNYITIRSDGLLIGRLDKSTGLPIGSYVVIGTDIVTVYDENGEAVSKFSADSIEFGKSSTLIKFLDGAAIIGIDGDGDFTFTFGNTKLECGDGFTTVQLLDDGTVVSEIKLNATGDTSITTPKKLKVNGYEVITANDICASGITHFTNVSVPTASVLLQRTISPPTGYMIVGICGYGLGELTDTPSYAKQISVSMVRFNNRYIYARLDNSSSSTVNGVSFYVQWFAVRATRIVYG